MQHPVGLMMSGVVYSLHSSKQVRDIDIIPGIPSPTPCIYARKRTPSEQMLGSGLWRANDGCHVVVA